MGYTDAKNMARGWCVEDSCPVQGDINLQQCADVCSNTTNCHSFNHTSIGRKSTCNLHNATHESSIYQYTAVWSQETITVNTTYKYGWEHEDTQKLGYSFCQKGKLGCAHRNDGYICSVNTIA